MNISWPIWVHQVSQVSHFLTVFNSSITFYIYLAKHGRRELLRLTSSVSNQSLNITSTHQHRALLRRVTVSVTVSTGIADTQV